jgi:glutaconate CoA-transferase subunit A
MAADKAYMSVEKIVPSAELSQHGCLHQMLINRMMVQGVVETPNGAHFTECTPDYERDEEFQKIYADSAADDGAWQSFVEKYVLVSEADYQKAVRR